jgi:hypothetical protein
MCVIAVMPIQYPVRGKAWSGQSYLTLGVLSWTMSRTAQLGWLLSSTAAFATMPPTECPTSITLWTPLALISVPHKKAHRYRSHDVSKLWLHTTNPTDRVFFLFCVHAHDLLDGEVHSVRLGEHITPVERAITLGEVQGKILEVGTLVVHMRGKRPGLVSTVHRIDVQLQLRRYSTEEDR